MNFLRFGNKTHSYLFQGSLKCAEFVILSSGNASGSCSILGSPCGQSFFVQLTDTRIQVKGCVDPGTKVLEIVEATHISGDSTVTADFFAKPLIEGGLAIMNSDPMVFGPVSAINAKSPIVPDQYCTLFDIAFGTSTTTISISIGT